VFTKDKKRPPTLASADSGVAFFFLLNSVFFVWGLHDDFYTRGIRHIRAKSYVSVLYAMYILRKVFIFFILLAS